MRKKGRRRKGKLTSKSSFSKHADRTPKINVDPRPMRGGIRL